MVAEHVNNNTVTSSSSHHFGTTMKGSSRMMTMMSMVFIVINVMIITSIVFPHHGVQGLPMLPNYPHSEMSAFPNLPSFPDEKIKELFFQCGREVSMDRFFTELSYSVKDFYGCDISRLWLDAARRHGISFPAHERITPRDDMRHFGNFRNDRNINKFGHGMQAGYHHRGHARDSFYPDRRDIEGMMQNEFRNDEMSHVLPYEESERGFPYLSERERFQNERVLQKEKVFCRQAETAEYCLAGDMIASCMWKKGKEFARREEEEKEARSDDAAKVSDDAAKVSDDAANVSADDAKLSDAKLSDDDAKVKDDAKLSDDDAKVKDDAKLSDDDAKVKDDAKLKGENLTPSKYFLLKIRTFLELKDEGKELKEQEVKEDEAKKLKEQEVKEDEAKKLKEQEVKEDEGKKLKEQEVKEDEEPKYCEHDRCFLYKLRTFLEKSLCLEVGEKIECAVPMQDLGFGQWPVTPIMFTGRSLYPLGGCRAITKGGEVYGKHHQLSPEEQFNVEL